MVQVEIMSLPNVKLFSNPFVINCGLISSVHAELSYTLW